MVVHVDISHEILNWIFANIEVDALSAEIREYLLSWKEGTKRPTFAQIQKVSKAINIPLGYFFLNTPPREDLSFIEYRTVKSHNIDKISRDLIDVMHDMTLVQDYMHQYMVANGYSPYNYVGAMNADDTSDNMACSIRELLGLKIDWFKDSKNAYSSFKTLRLAISDIGTIVMLNGVVGGNTHRPLKVEEFRAFTLIDEYAPLIFINTADSVNGRVFSLVHEFVHVCIGKKSLFNDFFNTQHHVSKTETLCNTVAAEILVPQDIFSLQWDNTKNLNNLSDRLVSLSSYFKCSKIVIARKALDNDFINKDEYTNVVSEIKSRIQDKKADKKGGGDYYNNLKSKIDTRFLNVLKADVQEGKTLYTQAFRLTHTNNSTFHKLIAAI